MKILIYKGSSQYGALNLFSELLQKSFNKIGHSIQIFDLTTQNAYQNLIELLSTNIYDLIIGFNGMGCELLVGDESIYNITKTHFLGIFVDHPAHHMSRLTAPSHFFLASFLDKTHIDFIQNIIPDSQKIKFFMPLAGIEESIDSWENFEKYKQTKDIDILFTGSYFGAPKKEWENNPNLPTKILDEATKLLIDNDYMNVKEAFDIVFEKNKMRFSIIGAAQTATLISFVISYIRQYKRDVILKKLFHSGLPITLYGLGWEPIAKEFKNVNYAGNISTEETAKLTTKAKVIVNLNANFTNGGHDRVFTGMLNGAVVFTDRSHYYDEFYQDKENYLLYSLHSLDKDIEQLRTFLQDDKKLFEMAKKSYAITKQNQTWDIKAKEIEELILFAKTINSLG